MRNAAQTAATLLIPLLLPLTACGDDAEEGSIREGSGGDALTTSASAVGAPTGETLAAAQHALRGFLDASRESTLDDVAVDSLADCGSDQQIFFPTTLLAGYTLLPFESRGDTVIGRAEVVTVAEQDVDRRSGNGFIARQRVRSDVLEWDVIPLGAGRWIVCNGLRFGYRGADSLTTCRPEGASFQSARRLADSIVKVSR